MANPAASPSSKIDARIPLKLKRKLKLLAKRTGISMSEYVLMSFDELFYKYPSQKELEDAYRARLIASLEKKQEAARG